MSGFRKEAESGLATSVGRERGSGPKGLETGDWRLYGVQLHVAPTDKTCRSLAGLFGSGGALPNVAVARTFHLPRSACKIREGQI